MTDNLNKPATPQNNATPDPAKPRQKKFPLWKNVLAMVAVLALFIAGGYWATVIYTHQNEEIAVPDLSGLTVEQAEDRLGALGLLCEVQDSIYNQDVADGLICDQSIFAGEKVKQGRTIYLTISSDMADQLTLPDLADNSSFREATAQLTAMGFTLTPPEYVDGEKDWVYGVKSNGRNIAAGAKVEVTSHITLVIGSGHYGPEEDMSSFGSDTLAADEEILELF